MVFGLGIVYLSNLFIKSSVLSDVALALMIVVTGLCLTVVKGSSRIISYLAFVISIVLLFAYRAPWSVWSQAFEENLYMVVMFSMVPLLKIPIRHGGYYEALRNVFQRFVHTRSRFYVFVALVSAFIGSIVNLAIVPLVYEVSRASRFSSEKKLLSAAMTRGFTSSTIWAPTMASIALIMQLTGTRWLLFFPFGIGSGILAGIVGYAITMYEGRKEPQREPQEPTAAEHGAQAAGSSGYGKFAELCGFAVFLIVLIAVVSFVTGIHTITIVSLAALIFPVFWMGILGLLPVLRREFRSTYFGESLPNLRSEVTLFAAAGFFATTINYTKLGEYIPRALSTVVGGNVLLLTIAVIAVSMALAVVGVHPIVTVAIIGGTVKAAAFGVSPTYMAMVLAISWAIGLSVSPSSATIIATAGLTGQSPVRVGTRWNGAYALVSAAVLILMITVLRITGVL
jgi:DcuC family C4-dicarboxylate transporter